MASFIKKGRSCACYKNVVREVWSMASLAIENITFLAGFNEIVGYDIPWKLVIFARPLLIKFDDITLSFCFRDIVVNRSWWHLLKQRFFPWGFFARSLLTEFNVVSAQWLLMEFDSITWEQRRSCACCFCLVRVQNVFAVNIPLAEILLRQFLRADGTWQN